MKIIMNTFPAAFQCPGGGEIQLLKSKEALETLGHEIILFNQWETDLEDCDVVHHFTVQGGSSNFCNYVYYNTDKPLILSPILWIGEDTSQYPMGEIQHLFNMADAICPNSIAETDKFKNAFEVDPAKFTVTHNGIDDIFHEKIDGQLFRDQFKIHEPFVLCVGNIETRKNQHRLVKAAEQAGIKLVLIGHIRDQSYFDSSGIVQSDNTQHIGTLGHHDPLLRSAYSACELFALPSLLETPGLAALEAAASGTDVIITNEGATEEYFGVQATYVNPTDLKCITEAITSCLNKSNIKPRNSIIEQLSWRKTGTQLESVYFQSIARTNKPKR
jgi:glycosyltransferase involved in cell wall biosynthesis